MPNINSVDRSHTDDATNATLDRIERKLGMLPNLIATLAHSPASLTGYVGLSEALSAGRLTARERELIALAVAQHNACAYCLSAHSAIAANLGLTDSQIRSARSGAATNARDAALLAFVTRVASAQGAVLAGDIEELRVAGFDDELVIEIVANVALNTLTNYVNNVARTEVDFSPVDVELAA